jgi:hypothetical protein
MQRQRNWGRQGTNLDEAVVEEEADGGADGDGRLLDLERHGVAHDLLHAGADGVVVGRAELLRRAAHHAAAAGSREQRQERREDPDPGAHPAALAKL